MSQPAVVYEHATTRRVLVPVDLTQDAGASLDWTLRYYADSLDEVVLVHVLDTTSPLWRAMGREFAALRIDERLRANVEEELRVLSAGVESNRPRCAVRTRIVSGAPADLILREARRWSVDLIVMDSHHREHGGRIGGVTASVLRSAPCPVLVVPPEIPPEPEE